MADEVRAERCETCRFWDYDGTDDSAMFCRRFPPLVVVVPDNVPPVSFMWPETCSNNWCGEWVVSLVLPQTPTFRPDGVSPGSEK